MSQDSLNMLKAYLAKHGHVLLIQVLQTWFHIDINNDTNKKNSVSTPSLHISHYSLKKKTKFFNDHPFK